MRVRPRRISEAETKDLWTRWREGESISGIARSLERQPAAVWQCLRRLGGFPPRERRRCSSHLSEVERESISRGLATGASLREIGRSIGRNVATISREVSRNGGRAAYRAASAERRAQVQASRPKRCKLEQAGRLRKAVAKCLQHNWSPEQISGWLKRNFAGEPTMQISHETIYRSLFIQARGVLKVELQDHLRSRQRMRKGHKSRSTPNDPGRIPDLVSIRERPAEVDDRAVPGHWEGDLLMGSPSDCIVTLVERSTRFVVLAKVQSKATHDVVPVLTSVIKTLPAELRQSLTWDRGKELVQHRQFTVDTNVAVYFCDPQSPWQRGSNENTNGLLRQYFPKGRSLADVTQAQLNAVATQLNQRPRKTLDFRTPGQAFNELLQ